jgi:hypothetical protein
MGGKWLDIVREIAPAVRRVALLFNPQTSPGGGSYFSRPIEAAASALGMQPIAMPVHGIDDLEPAVKSFTRDPMADWCPTGSTGATHFAKPLHTLIARRRGDRIGVYLPKRANSTIERGKQ